MLARKVGLGEESNMMLHRYFLMAFAALFVHAAEAQHVPHKPTHQVAAEGFESTAFLNEKYIAFAISSVDQNCNLLWNFETRILNQGAYGTARAGSADLPYQGLCFGQLFPFGVAWYTWTGGEAALQDSFVVNAKLPPPPDENWVPYTVVVKRADIHVNQVDLSTGLADINLNGSTIDTAGTITFEFETASGTISSQTTIAYYQPANNVQVKIDRPKISKGQYTKVKVKWNTVSFRRDNIYVYHVLETTYTPPTLWNVLGVIRYSQYNVSTETKCTGALVDKWEVDSVDTCNFTAAKFKRDFLEMTDLNGTGASVNFGYIKPGWTTIVKKACKGKFPNGANENNTYVHVPTVIGSCGTAMIPNVSVATKPKNCNATEVLVNRSTNVNFASKDADDLCPVCNTDFRGTDGHIDHFTNVDSCNPRDINDLGDFWTLQRP
jgi:hypothetical protein